MLGRDGRLIVGGSAEEGQDLVLRVVLGLGYLHGEHLELTSLGSSVRAREDPKDECMLHPITPTLSQPVSSALVLVLPQLPHLPSIQLIWRARPALSACQPFGDRYPLDFSYLS